MRGRKKKYDNTIEMNILLSLVFMCLLGAIILFSASADYCVLHHEGNPYHSLKNQLYFMGGGFAAVLVISRLNYLVLARLSWLAYGVSIASIAALRFVGITANGATRWLGAGSFRFQVAELVKAAVILILARYISRHFEKNDNRAALTLRAWLLGGVPAVMLFFISSDFSSAVVILMIVFVITFTTMRTTKLHLVTGLAAVIVVAAYIMHIAANMPSAADLKEMNFRDVRIAVFLDPERYAQSAGYQTMQALYAVGAGGLIGRGLGNSLQKYMIPEPHTDMIFSIMCEELGLLGVFMYFLLLGYLLYLIAKVAANAETLYGSIVALGTFTHLFVQSVFNIAVNLNLLPNTGLPLPFISYGGTSLLLMMAECGLVLSVERHHEIEKYKRSKKVIASLTGSHKGSDGKKTGEEKLEENRKIVG